MKKKILGFLMVFVLIVGCVGVGSFAYFSDSESAENVFCAGTLNLERGITDAPIEVKDMAPGKIDEYTIVWENIGSLSGDLSWEISVDEADGALGVPANDVNVSPQDFAKCVALTSIYFDRDTDGLFQEPSGENGIPCTEESSWTGLDVGTAANTLIPGRSTAESPVHTTGVVQDTSELGEATDDELITLDWIQLGDHVNGNGDGKLTVSELDGIGRWNVNDNGGTSSAMNPDEVYTFIIAVMLDDSLYAGNDVVDLQGDGIKLTITVTLDQVQ